MANIVDPELVKASNEMARRLNDMQVAHYRTCKAFKQKFDTMGWGTPLANNSDVIVDGAPADGRHAMTAFDFKNVYNRASEVVVDYEANTNTKLNQANVIAVNTNPLF